MIEQAECVYFFGTGSSLVVRSCFMRLGVVCPDGFAWTTSILDKNRSAWFFFRNNYLRHDSLLDAQGYVEQTVLFTSMLSKGDQDFTETRTVANQGSILYIQRLSAQLPMLCHWLVYVYFLEIDRKAKKRFLIAIGKIKTQWLSVEIV